MGEAVAIPPRRWFGFIAAPSSSDPVAAPARIEPRDPIAIAPRRWLGFVAEPSPYRAATWGVPAVGGMLALGLVVGVLAIGAEAQGNESDSAVIEDIGDGETIASASVVPEPEPAKPSQPEPPRDPIPAATLPVAAAGPIATPEPVRKRVVIEPMTPAQLRKAQRVAKQLDGALSEGRVKTSSLSFAVVPDPEGTFWSEASTLCSELVVDGVAGWRLPSVGELRDLGRARALPGAAYWSRSNGRDPEMARVYSTRTRKSGAWLKSDPTGVTVCVQPRPRAPEAGGEA